MKRKYYSSKDIEQRSHEWFIARMAKFTSSEVYHLFTDSTQKAKAEAALHEVKEGTWNNKQLMAMTDTKQIDFACKCLGIDSDKKKEVKAQILGAEGWSKLCDKVLEFNSAFNSIHEFSEGAKTYILKKATELLFPSPEASIQSGPMQRGQELEPEAIEAYLKLRGYKGKDISFVELGEDTASSPDKLVIVDSLKEKQKGGVEIKCRSQINHAKAILNLKSESDLLDYDSKAFWQCHHQIWVCGLDWVDYVHYHPDLYKVYDPNKGEWIDGAYKHKALHIIRVHKEESIIKQFEKVIPLAAKLRDEYLKELLK